MAMYVSKNKVYIFVADSDGIPDNRIKDSKNSNSITTNYCPPESKEQNKLFYEFLGDLDELKNKHVYLDSKKMKNYYNTMEKRIQNKFSGIYKGNMDDFKENCEELISYGDCLISNNLFLTGSRPYLQFSSSKLWELFKSIIYGESSIIVLESYPKCFLVYPLFRPLFSKINEINFEGLEVDLNSSNTQFNLYGIHIKDDNNALNSANPYICIGWPELGDLSQYNTKEEFKEACSNIYVDKTSSAHAQYIGQLIKFSQKANIGDYVVFSNGNLVHIGKITSDYYYQKEVEEGCHEGYVNRRNVEWIKLNYDKSNLTKAFQNSLGAQMSFFSLNDYKSAILDIINNTYEKDDEEELSSNDNLNIKVEYKYDSFNKEVVGKNLVVYGTPGCGKSYYVEHELLKYGDNDEHMESIRTTFYQDYTNTDFVGQIMPIVKEDGSVTYEFNPGPFTLALNKALQNPNKPIALVIEELNRGNAASIFGDIFQLLDRNSEGISEYKITNVNVQKYLESQNPDYNFNYIKLPNNLNIFATMNTSDQNVFTLDTAFKRRWKFEKIKNTFDDNHPFGKHLIPGMDLDWEQFCTSINKFILESKDEITNSEDKQLGVFFVDEKGLRKDVAKVSTEDERKEFAYKVFEYLWDDVAKYSRDSLFKDVKSLDDLIDKYVELGENDINGKDVFVDNILVK